MKYLFLTVLAFSFLTSCTTTKIQTKIIKKTIHDTVYIEKAKEEKSKVYKAASLDKYTIADDYFPAIGQDYRQKFLILHYTALHNDRSYQVLTQQQVSSHYLISDKYHNYIDILVSEDARAWHAGVSYWKGRTNVNDSSIGIEIVNQGYTSNKGKMVFFPYADYQIKKVGELCKDIVERYEIDPTFVLGHSDVAPQRKEDPGAFFPWKRLYDEYNVGAWYDDVDKNYYLSQYPYGEIDSTDFILKTQKAFAKYGYEVKETGVWDEQTQRLVMIFQMHFRPSNYSGIMDAETWAILMALNYKYRD